MRYWWLALLQASAITSIEEVAHADDDLIAYVPLGKVGSSSFRHFLAIRNEIHFGTEALCYANIKKGDGGAVPHTKCLDLPAGTVVQASHGFCELAHHFTQRRCRYITLMREPVARYISDWSYFCRSCSEGGRACPQEPQVVREASAHNQRLPREVDGRPRARPKNSCPNMSVIDYASMYLATYTTPTHYVQHFGHDMGTIAFDNKTFLRAPTIEHALRNLHMPNMMVLFTEELSVGGLEYLWRSVLHEEGPPPPFTVANRGNHHHAAQAANDTDALTRILALDIYIYWNMHALWGINKSALSRW